MAPVAIEEGIIQKFIKNDHVRWWNKPNLRTLYLLLVPFCLFIESTSGFDSSMMNGMQALNYWQEYFNHPKGAMLGLLVACYNVGAVSSIPFVAIVTDHVGRRWSIVFGSVIMIIGAIMQGLARNSQYCPLMAVSTLTAVVAMFIFARIFLGHGIVYAIISGAALLGELGHPKERQFLGSMFNAFFGVGAVLGAGIVVRTIEIKSDWSWRLPSILQCLPSLIQVGFAFTVPESPRWLVSKDRSEEALAILIKYHAEGDASNELPHLELAEIRKALEIENDSRKRGWAELFQTQGMRRRSLVSGFLGLFVQFSGNSLISQYLVPILGMIGITDRWQQVRYNVGKEAWGLIIGIALAAITPRFPRRRMYLLCASCLLFVYTGWTVAQARNNITGSVASGYAVLVFIFLYSPAYCLGYNALTYVYMVEIFPYYVRTKGLSWFQFWSRSAAMFSSFVNPIGLTDIGWKYLLTYVCWLCFEVVFIYFFFPETFGKTLEELTFLFEDEQEARQVFEASTEKVLQDPSAVTEIHESPEKKV